MDTIRTIIRSVFWFALELFAGVEDPEKAAREQKQTRERASRPSRPSPPGSDAGFGQIGCGFILVSAPVGAVVGFFIVLVTTDFGAAVGAAATGLIAGWLSGGFAAWFGLRLAVRMRSRYDPEAVGLAFALVGPALIALLVALVVGLSEAYGGLDRFLRSFSPP